MTRLRQMIQALDRWWGKPHRIDHHPLVICALSGLIGPSLAIVLVGPVPSSVLEGMPNWLQIIMCACIVFGCGGMVHGALLGTRWYFYGSRRKALRRAYTSAPLAVSGLIVYGLFILANTGGNFISALSGVLTPFLGLGLFLVSLMYVLEDRRLEHAEPAVIEELLAEEAERDDG